MKVLEDEKYHRERVDLIYSRKYGIYILSFITALVFIYIYNENQSTLSVMGWLGALTSYVGVRFFISIYYWDSRSSKSFKYQKYEEINFIISTLGGLIWGISTPLFLLNQLPHNLLFAISIYTGVCAGGLISNSASLKANIGYTFSLLTTSAISFLFYDYPEKHSIIILLTLFNIACIYCAIMINKLVLNNLKLSCNNLKLLEELRESNVKQLLIEKEALQSSNLATIGEMASGMAHEINNPLAIIKGNLNLLKRHMKINSILVTDDYADKSINKCLDSIQRIVNVSGSLKKMSQMNFNNPAIDISVREILNNSLGFINEKLKCSNIKLIRETKDEEIVIQCDSTTTSQILLSIISHAFQTCIQRKYEWIRVKAKVEDEYVYFEVESVKNDDHNNEDLSALILNYCEYNSQKNNHKSFNLTLTQSMATKVGGELILDKNNCQLVILKLPIQIRKNSSTYSAA